MFDEKVILQFLIIYVYILFFISINIYYILLYLFIEIILFGLFISFIQMELFTGFLWVVEFTIIFIAILLLFYLNVEGNMFKINLFVYKYYYGFLLFIFFCLSIFYYSFNMESFYLDFFFYFFYLDDYYEALNNTIMNDFLVLTISYYTINNIEFLLIGFLLLVGSLVCVYFNKSQFLYKNFLFFNILNYYNLYNNFLYYFFFRRQDLLKQSYFKDSIRMFKKK